MTLQRMLCSLAHVPVVSCLVSSAGKVPVLSYTARCVMKAASASQSATPLQGWKDSIVDRTGGVHEEVHLGPQHHQLHHISICDKRRPHPTSNLVLGPSSGSELPAQVAEPPALRLRDLTVGRALVWCRRTMLVAVATPINACAWHVADLHCRSWCTSQCTCHHCITNNSHCIKTLRTHSPILTAASVHRTAISCHAFWL